MAQRLDFIDVSHWQSDAGVIDWGDVSRAGVLGVIIKATEGTTYRDPGYRNNRKGALAAGLKVATYHFLKHGSVDEQMVHYLTTVAPRPGERLVIDYEDKNCTYQDLKVAVASLKRRAPQCEISVYGSAKLTENVREMGSAATVDMAGTSAWMARYSANEPVVATNAWPSWSAWQYSDKLTVDGVTGPCDTNMFNGSREACVQWIGPPTDEPGSGVEPAPSGEVRHEMRVTSGSKVAVVINGQLVFEGTAL